METVSDLPRLRSPFACALGIEPGAVATDHVNCWMPFEPLGSGSGRAVWQHVHHMSPFQIDDHCSVVHTLLPRPIIDARHPDQRRVRGGLRASLYLSQSFDSK